MKLVIPAIIVLVLTAGGVMWINRSKPPAKPDGAAVTPVMRPEGKEVTSGGEQFVYFAKVLSGNYRARLVGNLPGKKPAAELMQANGCAAGINGGFYGTNNRNLGLVVSDSTEVSPESASDMFNGVVFADAQDRLQIGRRPGVDMQWRQAGQTGPMLIEAGQIIKLQLVSDKAARRMVVADLGVEHGIALLAIARKNAMLDGPHLANLAQVVSDIGPLEGWPPIQSAINMDGGAASAMIAENIVINEWQPVGSWWCISQ